MKLPWWRLIAGLLVLLALASVLIALGPVYFEDYQLRQYVRSAVGRSDTAPGSDDALRASILTRAKQLDLPVAAGEVEISHPGGKLRVQLNYAVQMDFALYQVDLHFHPGATSR